MKKREKVFIFLSLLVVWKKNIHLKDKEIKCFDSEPAKKAKWNQEFLGGRGDLWQMQGSAEPSPRLHAPTAGPLGGQAAFRGLKAHQETSYQG